MACPTPQAQALIDRLGLTRRMLGDTPDLRESWAQLDELRDFVWPEDLSEQVTLLLDLVLALIDDVEALHARPVVDAAGPQPLRLTLSQE